ncbi:MAG: hypothetical protein HZB11_00645 [Candidatus Yonathbacteria bacterium]|nr:hypothetical protein [Candidatus Yonathbacteria bacterium]
MKRNNIKRGFTLVEMIIYIGFFAMLSIIAVNGTIVAMKSFYALRLTQSVNESATVALERMSREIRNAYDIDTTNSTFSTSTGRLTLKTKDDLGANTTVEFYVDGANQLNMKVGGVDNGPIVTKTVTLTNLIFRSISTTNSKAIKVDMTLKDSRTTSGQTSKFYDTIILRGSVH